MNLTNEISFDQQPVQGQEAKINYNGYLSDRNQVTLVYGYDNEWKDTDTLPMAKVGKGYEAVLKIKPYGKLNFCFKDGDNNWDNNYGNNFSIDIEEAHVAEQDTTIAEEIANEAAVDTTDNIEYADIQKIETELTQLFDQLFSEEEFVKDTVQDTGFEAVEYTSLEPDTTQNAQEFDLDELIDQILTPILSQPVPVHVPVDEMRVNDVKNFTQLDSVSDIVDDILNNVDTQYASADMDLDEYDDIINSLIATTDLAEEPAVVADFIQEIATEEVEVKPAKIAKKDFTILEDDLEQELAEEPSLLESEVDDARNERVSANQSLVVTDEENDLVAPRKLSSVYMMFKKIRVALTKAWYNLFNGSKPQEF